MESYPFYDLLNVKIILSKDKEDSALLLGGKKENFNKKYFDRLGGVLKLNDKQVNSVYKKFDKWLPKAIEMIDVSFIDVEGKTRYKEMLQERVSIFI